MKLYKNIKRSFVMGMLVFSITSCSKREFMPEPLGEEIPSPERPSVIAALTASSNTLFKAAWERVNMDQILKQEAPKFKVTILVPSDEAMIKAGLTAAAIAQTNIKDLTAIVRFHVVKAEFTLGSLKISAAQSFNTMLTNPELLEGQKDGDYAMISVPYTYRQFLDTDGTSLIANGKKTSTGKEIIVANGNLLPIGIVLEYPKKQMLDILKADGRFKLYLEALSISRQLYDSFLLETFAEPRPGSMEYWMDVNTMTPGNFKASRKSDVSRLTLFAPTDEAFRHAGINSAADFVALNDRNPYDGFSQIETDKLLRLHVQGFATPVLEIDWDNFDIEPGAAIYTTASGGAANMVFFSNLLNPQHLGNYVTSTLGEHGTYTYLDLDFGKDASGKITVKQKGATTEAAIIVEENINSLQGPIHVVNRLIIPKDFKLR